MERELPVNIPLDIVSDILSRLSVKPLYRFKCVSKQWLALINDPQFIKSHFEFSNKSKNQVMIASGNVNPYSAYSIYFQTPNESFDEHKLFFKDKVNILSSCNGVLLLGDLSVPSLPTHLWNPSTRSYQKVSLPLDRRTLPTAFHGLAYDSVQDEFKIVTVTYDFHIPNHIYVFRFISSSWKMTQDFPNPGEPNIPNDFGPLTVVNGATHLIWWRGMESMIMRFDPHQETFEVVPHLDIVTKNYVGIKLTSLGGNLCVVGNHERGIDVWVRKESSWSKLFVVPRSTCDDFLAIKRDSSQEFIDYYFKPFCFAGEGGSDVVAVIKGSNIFIYSVKENMFRKVDIPPSYGLYFQVACYAESLISLCDVY